MREKLDGNRTGLIFGYFLAGVHVLWSLMVLFGVAQSYMNWMFGLHMLNSFLTVTAFSWTSAITLIIVTFVMGYILGRIYAWAHNFVHK